MTYRKDGKRGSSVPSEEFLNEVERGIPGFLQKPDFEEQGVQPFSRGRKMVFYGSSSL